MPFKVSFSSYPDETADLCDLVLPDNHALESWGDAEPVKGTLALQQPAMDPVFDTRRPADVLIAVAKADRRWRRSIARPTIARGSRPVRRRIDGVHEGAADGNDDGSHARGRLAAEAVDGKVPRRSTDAPAIIYRFIVYPSPALGDGRGANKPWLQELPDPVTKIAWQTVVELHPETAMKLGIEEGEHCDRRDEDRGAITAPVYLFIGLRPDTSRRHWTRPHVVRPLRQRCRREPDDAAPVGEDQAGAVVLIHEGVAPQVGATARSSPPKARRASTAAASRARSPSPLGAPPRREGRAGMSVGHASTRSCRGCARRSRTTRRATSAIRNRRTRGSTTRHWSGVAKRRWAMTIDLARCTGCAACVTACYSENNIPTVGAPWQGRACCPTGPDSA